MSNQQPNIDYIWKLVKRLGNLYVENARLTLTEKLTRLLSTIALVAVVFVLISMCLLFLSVCVCDILVEKLSPTGACLIVGGFYLLIILVIILLRRPLILDPVCRFLSRVIIEHPNDLRNDNGNG